MIPQPALRLLDDETAVLLEPYHWPFALPVTVPAGFRNDGATVPPPWWWLIGHPWKLSLLAIALPHDYELACGVEWFEAWRRMRIRARYTPLPRWKRALVLLAVWLRGVWRKIRPPVRTRARAS